MGLVLNSSRRVRTDINLVLSENGYYALYTMPFHFVCRSYAVWCPILVIIYELENLKLSRVYEAIFVWEYMNGEGLILHDKHKLLVRN